MTDEKYMWRALELAGKGIGQISPNPMVGCVIVHDEKIIGEGYHKKYGEGHAEVNAILSVENEDLLDSSTVYVTLEPCSHHGKTPPCANLLISKRIKKVVIACEDPFHKVAGSGIKKLQEAGIEVEVGLLAKEAAELNRRFITFQTKGRPYIILKWAQTSDGFIARENGNSKWISSEQSRQLVHKWRSEEDAILVGKNTALNDDPSLTSRDWSGKNPVRILLDSKLSVSKDFSLFNSESKTIIFNLEKDDKSDPHQWVKLKDMNSKSVLDALQTFKIESLIIEGGAQVLNSFIQDDCWDEARVFTSPKTFGNGIEAPILNGALKQEASIFEDQLRIILNSNG